MDKVDIIEYQNLSEPVRVTVVTGLLNIPDTGVPKGGKKGQNLTKKSDSDFDTYWADPDDINSIEHITLNGEDVPVEDKTAKITVDKSTVGLENIYAELNENIIRNPNYNYFIAKTADFGLFALGTGEILWGDGTKTIVSNPYEQFSHKYTDGIVYHMVVTTMGVNIDSDVIKAWIGITPPDSLNVSADEYLSISNMSAVLGCSFKSPILHVDMSTPPLFDGSTINANKIIVPKSAINAYKSATGWSNYADKIVYEIDSSDLDEEITALDKEHIAYLNKENTFTKAQTISYADDDSHEYAEIGGSGADYSYTEYTDDTHKYYTLKKATISASFGRVQVGESVYNENGRTKSSLQLNLKGNQIVRTEVTGGVQTYYACVFPKTYPNKEVTLATIEDLTAQFGSLNIQNGTGENSLIQKAPKGKENTAEMEGGIAFGKNCHANQKYDFAIGGANAIAGFTKEQFNSYYWDGTQALHGGKGKDSDGNILDFTGSKYEDSFGYNFAVGDTAIANGRTAVAFQQGKAYGKEAVAFGTSTADGEQAFAINNSYASGYDSFSQGSNTVAKYAQQAVFGRWNENKEDDIFEVGVGSGEPDPTYGLPETKNAFEITKTGKVKVLNEPSENNEVVRKQELDTKYDKTGGTIGGNVIITGDLTVNGTQHINNTENLNVENAMIYSNAKGATLATNGGIGIKKNATDVYGIVYDPTSDSVKLGLGKSDANGKFTFNTDEGQPVAIRDDSSKFNANHFIKWNEEQKKLIDSGYIAEDFVDVATQQTIAGMKTFTDEVHFGTAHFSKDLNVDNAIVKIFDNQKDLVTQYKSDSITIDNGTGSSAVQYVLTLPKETGTLLLNKFKYSTFGSSNDGDSWNLNDGTKNLEIKYQDDNSHSSISLEKDYIELSNINGTGAAKISLASNVITLDAVDSSENHKIIRINPDKVIIGNSTDTLLVEIDSLSAKFNNRPQVKDNGNYVNVALVDDLNNYVASQSESSDKYYAQIINENGIISVRIFQNGGEDVQNLTIDKDGVKVLGKNIATTDGLDTKVDKLAESLRNQAYVRNADGEDTGLAYTYTDEGNTLALRNASGQVQVSDPSQDKDAVNKSYADNINARYVSTSILGG